MRRLRTSDSCQMSNVGSGSDCKAEVDMWIKPGFEGSIIGCVASSTVGKVQRIEQHGVRLGCDICGIIF